VTPARPPTTAVAELAALQGVQVSFAGADGRAQAADEDAIRAILAALGTPVTSAAQAAIALREATRARAIRPLEPVLVHRIGDTTATVATVTLPERVSPRDVWWTLELEDGSVERQRLVPALLGMTAGTGEGVRHYRFQLGSGSEQGIVAGYHRLVVEWPGATHHALLIAAPRCPDAARGWGAFLPLHALRTAQDWGVGSYADMAALGSWVTGRGGSMVGALPLYPAFLEPPADPSPYLPVSRLAYNEVFIDPTSLPELAATPEACRLLNDDAFRRRLSAVHHSTLVDYEEVARLRRQVLAPMADTLLAGNSPRRDEFCAFVDRHPELEAYAGFRALGERVGRRAAEDRRPTGAGADREPASGYHLYTQWVAAEQLATAAATAPLYADLPIGVHPDGFDPIWAPDSFVPGVHGGAPPDLFFAAGQDWAFPPLHPQGIREDGYRYVIDTLRHAFRHASCLRVDHIMGLQRLYWIPPGFDARHGAYVSYRADELHALVALEAHRTGSTVVGEDLGTVPDGVRARMAEDHMLRSWVLQFESTPEEPLPTPPPAVLASWATHDLPRFGVYFGGDDIDENEAAGLLSPADAAVERTERERWRAAILGALGPAADADADAAAILRACLRHLAASAADLVLVDLEELWGERQPQNRPGTGTGGANWRRRAGFTLEELRLHDEINDFLGQLTCLRSEVPAAAGRGARR
jgi:4-alpha-glucanotransferase